MRYLLAIWISRLAAFFSRLTGKGQGSALPGMVAKKIYPAILAKMGKQIAGPIVAVTGTNGKTTTNNMIKAMLEKSNFEVVTNINGANMLTGLITAFLHSCDWKGKIASNAACLEVDEATVPLLLQSIEPDWLVVTNFFQDQLDRYGELDTTIGFVVNSLPQLKKTRLILNADDPLSAQIGRRCNLKAYYYGLSQHQGVTLSNSDDRESKCCPFCGSELEYEYFHYSQLGKYRCPQGDFERPQPDLEGLEPIVGQREISCFLRSRQNKTSETLYLPLDGFYNLYNGLAAWLCGKMLKLDSEDMFRALVSYRPAIGRMEQFIYQERPVLLNLVKNPTGFNQGLNSLMALNSDSVAVGIFINDQEADGTDISWLWNVDFEKLADNSKKWQVFLCSGRRAYDMAVRLKYANLPLSKIKVETEVSQAVLQLLHTEAEQYYFFTTYTALWPLERTLRNEAKRKEDSDLPSVS